MTDLVIPRSVLESARLSPDELKCEVAVLLFAQDRLTLGQAARLAGSSQAAFMRVLAEREIPLHYGVEELEQDLRTLDALGS